MIVYPGKHLPYKGGLIFDFSKVYDFKAVLVLFFLTGCFYTGTNYLYYCQNCKRELSIAELFKNKCKACGAHYIPAPQFRKALVKSWEVYIACVFVIIWFYLAYKA